MANMNKKKIRWFRKKSAQNNEDKVSWHPEHYIVEEYSASCEVIESIILQQSASARLNPTDIYLSQVMKLFCFFPQIDQVEFGFSWTWKRKDFIGVI